MDIAWALYVLGKRVILSYDELIEAIMSKCPDI